jgi:hypothetical protein
VRDGCLVAGRDVRNDRRRSGLSLVGLCVVIHRVGSGQSNATHGHVSGNCEILYSAHYISERSCMRFDLLGADDIRS